MKDDVASKEKLIGPQLAVQSYLDELLQDATFDGELNSSEDSDESIPESEAIEDSTTEEIKIELEATTQEDAVVETVDQIEESSVESVNEVEIHVEEEIAATEPEIELVVEEEIAEPEVALATESEEVVESTEVTTTASNNEVAIEAEQPKTEIAPTKTGPLPWAESRFECLLFNVGGLKMAVPLVELGSIQKANIDTITRIFGQPDWFIGISSINDVRIKTVDTAKWVMPNHFKGQLDDSFKFIIQLDRSSWGLACEEVAEAISLDPSEVKWRSDRSTRPWLAGTVIKHMCAILDVQGFIELLDDPKNGFNPAKLK